MLDQVFTVRGREVEDLITGPPCAARAFRTDCETPSGQLRVSGPVFVKGTAREFPEMRFIIVAEDGSADAMAARRLCESVGLRPTSR